MNNHIEAWNHVKSHLFGTVCEVARRTPWGFKEDRPDIINIDIETFLNSEDKYDTIILHILCGEGESIENVIKVIDAAYHRCIKLVILEHNPEHMDWNDNPSVVRINTALIHERLIHIYDELIIEENWGRNMLFACTTMSPLHLPQLNDEYYKENINKVFVTPEDKGIDKKHLIYIHTSESPIDFELPKGKIWWVAGGGLCFESMKEENENIVFDSVLKQILFWTYWWNNRYPWKLERLYSFGEINIPEYQEQDNDPMHWRFVTHNGKHFSDSLPNSIQHINIQDLNCKGDTVYVSTIDKKYWKHLEEENNIIDAWTTRDKPVLRECRS